MKATTSRIPVEIDVRTLQLDAGINGNSRRRKLPRVVEEIESRTKAELPRNRRSEINSNSIHAHVPIHAIRREWRSIPCSRGRTCNEVRILRDASGNHNTQHSENQKLNANNPPVSRFQSDTFPFRTSAVSADVSAGLVPAKRLTRSTTPKEGSLRKTAR